MNIGLIQQPSTAATDSVKMLTLTPMSNLYARFLQHWFMTKKKIPSERSCSSSNSCGATLATDETPSLDDIVHCYQKHGQRILNAEFEFFQGITEFKSAIEHAALSKDAAGKRHPHQFRLQRQVLEELNNRLEKETPTIKACRTFHELWQLVGNIAASIRGVGPLTTYDVSARLGAHLKLMPERIYLHAGALLGAKNLRVATDGSVIDASVLPYELQSLRPEHIENLLCIHKEDLKRWRESQPD